MRTAELTPEDVVLEVGPGLGSLTLGLLPVAAHVTAVEIDPRLAALLPRTVAERAPALAGRLTVVEADALRVREIPGPPPTALVANLPYNVAVPVLLHLLELLPTLDRALILVQAEGEGAQARADLQHHVVGAHLGGADDPADRVRVVQEVLPEGLRGTQIELLGQLADGGGAQQPVGLLGCGAQGDPIS